MIIRSLLASFLSLSIHASAVAFAAGDGAGDNYKVLRTVAIQAENSFDPQFESEEGSLQYCEDMFDSLLSYDYLARPVKLIPHAANALPEVSADGLTYTFRIRPGVYFTPDPAFKGKKRELVAADAVYSLKRLLDPKVRSPWKFLLDGKIVGAKAVLAANKERLNYDTPMEGLRALDRYTLRIQLVEPDFKLPYLMATPATGIVAREVVEAYGADFGSHPVGTGPYMLKTDEWRRSSRIVLVKNPGYREEYFHAEPENTPEDAEIEKAMNGKRIPQIDRIEINIVEAEQPRWLAFLNKEMDLSELIPEEYATVAAPGGKVAPNLAKQGIKLFREAKPDVWYTMFGMEDPVTGGYTPEKIALRRAITLAIDTTADINIVRNGMALQAQSPIPPGIPGYDPAFINPYGISDPARSKALLDMFGYVDRDGDGFREQPDGSPLLIKYWSQPTAMARRLDELIDKSLRAIGIRIEIHKAPVPELRKMGKQGVLQMRTDGWQADYPDAENFFQNLYGPNAGQANYSRFNLPAFNKLYEKTAAMPDSPERNVLYREMANLVLVYAPWRLAVHRIQNHMYYPWVIGYKKHPFLAKTWRYLDIDVAQQRAALQ